MAATPSLKIVKTITWRGEYKPWSNRYHFNGGVPGSGSAWEDFADDVVAAEHLVLANFCQIVEALGYEAGSEVPVWSKTYATDGVGGFASSQVVPGQDAAYVRYATTARSAKNHPIYLGNFYHGAMRDSTAGTDDLNAAQKTALETYATAWIAGFSDGTHTLVRAGPNGATAVSRLVSPWITHRDFS